MSDYFNPQPKSYSQPKLKKPMKKVSDKNKDPKTGFRKASGELAVFCEVFVERRGKCEITGEPIQFSPECFLHVLNKNRWKKHRLDKRNIFMVVFDVHNLYDNGSKEFLLSKYPKAVIIYERKDELKHKYSIDGEE